MSIFRYNALGDIRLFLYRHLTRQEHAKRDIQMAVEFTINQVGNILHVIIMGVVQSVDDILCYATPFRKKAQELGISRILLDYQQAKYNLDYYGMIKLADIAQEKMFHKNGFRLATRVSPNDYKLLIDQQTPAINRGLNYQAFTEKDAALLWLQEN